MLHRVILAIIGLAGAGQAAAQAPAQIWARQFGTPDDEFVGGVVTDGNGGVIVGGYTYGGLGGPSAGSADIFLARYDGAGTPLWVRQFGSSAFEQGRAMAPTAGGGALIVGSTSGTLGAASLGAADAFMAHYDGAGNQVWVGQLGTSAGDFALGVARSGLANVIVGGATGGDLGGPSAGGQDAFIARFDLATHTLVWVRQLGTALGETGNGVAFDGAGGLYVGGFTSGALGGPSAGGDDAFVARYDLAGNQLWVRQLGTSSGEIAGNLASDGAGGVVFGGYTYGSMVGPASGAGDVFLARYDNAGNQLWLRQFGSSDFEYGTDLHAHGGGATLFTGVTYGGMWGGVNAGSSDGLLARFDAPTNQFEWGLQFGTTGHETTAGVADDGPDILFVAGDTSGALGGPNAGGHDAYLVRFGNPCYPDCNLDGSLTVADFGCYQTKFVSADLYADCNGSGALTVADFGCFQTSFVAGCP